ncbi:hypothetical protein PROFUN_14547 [Planoprotostelium fungivorum]|uniref:Serine incorporator n=1 Tax=Planoprotostelium fungivorum TaxID=1890364 RepID=A0A2P6MZN1_9EUKA|nr:hypothetical protein PROFUN_14547 [Planoprotostelium fungivorum]
MSAIGGRIVYSVFFFITAIIAWALKTWGNSERLHWIKAIRTGCENSVDKNLCFETETVYRITAAVALFHFFMALLMVGVRRHGDFRHSLQDGWWGVKILLMVGAAVGFFFIPNVAFHYYSWFALAGAGIFILVQLVYLVDFAHSWAENWIEKMEEDLDSKKWLYILMGATAVLGLLTITGTVLAYVFFHAVKSIMVVTINLLLTVLIYFISVHPKVQEVWPKSGLLQPAVVGLYTTWLMWSANLSDNSLDNPFHRTDNSPKSPTFNVVLFIGAIFTIISILYATISTASHLGSSHTEETEPLTQGEDEESGKKEVDGDEPVAYNYSVFHLVFALGAMYVAMLMTDWATVHNPSNDSAMASSGTAAFWVKSASALVCFLLYSWTLIAPVVLPDRDIQHLLSLNGQSQDPTPHRQTPCPCIPQHRCPEKLPYHPLPQFTYTSSPPFFRVFPLDCRVLSYQLTSNSLVAPNRVKLLDKCHVMRNTRKCNMRQPILILRFKIVHDDNVSTWNRNQIENQILSWWSYEPGH